MKDFKDKSNLKLAQDNFKQSLDDLFSIVEVEDRDGPLGQGNEETYSGILRDADSSVVVLLTMLY